jgi:hypothetical protein
MAVTLRQSAEGTMINTASPSWDATFASVPNSGSLLVAVASFQQTADGGRTAVLTSGWTQLLPGTQAYNGLAVWAKIAGASESQTATVTVDLDNNNGALTLAEFEGDFNSASVTSALKQAVSWQSSVTSKATPSLSPTGPALLLPLLGRQGNTGTVTIGSPWTVYKSVAPQTFNYSRGQTAAWDEVAAGTHSGTFSWTTSSGAVTAAVAFPLEATASEAPSGFGASQIPAVRVSWNDDGGPYTVRRNTVTLASGISGTEYVDDDVTIGLSYDYTVEGSNAVESSAVTVNVQAGGGGLRWLRRDGSGWSATPA